MRLALTTSRVPLAERSLTVRHPPDAAALIDDDAFAHNEFLPYWAELWPSGVALARAAEQLVRPGDRVLELGCGLALPSIAAALAGGDVTATDWSPDALELVARNARGNGTRVATMHAPWADAGDLVEQGPWDWVLAADLLYEARNVPLLTALLPRLVTDGAVLLAEPGRPFAETFFAKLGDWHQEPLAADPDHPSVTLRALRRRR